MTSRRAILGGAGMAFAAGAAHARSEGDAAVIMSPPPDVGAKFWPDGRVRPFAGNTVICHLSQQEAGFEAFDALLEPYREWAAYGFARKFALLPPSSYHCTIFGGAVDQARQPGLWPADIPRDAPMEVCDDLVGRQLKGFRLDCDLPIRLVVNDAAPPVYPNPVLIPLLPADGREERKLRRLRDRLSEQMHIRAPNHDVFEFHMGIAYQIQWLDAAERQDWEMVQRRWRKALKARAPVIHLGAPEFCTFKDMFAYRRRFYLR